MVNPEETGESSTTNVYEGEWEEDSRDGVQLVIVCHATLSVLMSAHIQLLPSSLKPERKMERDDESLNVHTHLTRSELS